jgi:hypothetical protein
LPLPRLTLRFGRWRRLLRAYLDGRSSLGHRPCWRFFNNDAILGGNMAPWLVVIASWFVRTAIVCAAFVAIAIAPASTAPAVAPSPSAPLVLTFLARLFALIGGLFPVSRFDRCIGDIRFAIPLRVIGETLFMVTLRMMSVIAAFMTTAPPAAPPAPPPPPPGGLAALVI